MNTPESQTPKKRRAPGAGRKPNVAGEVRTPLQFSLSSVDRARLERFMHSAALTNRSEALRVLLTRAGF